MGDRTSASNWQASSIPGGRAADFDVIRQHVETYEGMDIVPTLREDVDRWRHASGGERDRLMLHHPVWRFVARDIEWRVTGAFGGVLHGWDGLFEFWGDWLGVWETYKFNVASHRSLGDGIFLTVVRVDARGRDGIPLEMDVFELRRVRNRLIDAYWAFLSEGEALAAVDELRQTAKPD